MQIIGSGVTRDLSHGEILAEGGPCTSQYSVKNWEMIVKPGVEDFYTKTSAENIPKNFQKNE